MQPPLEPIRPFVGPGRTTFGVGSSALIGSELRAMAITGRVVVVADAALIELDRLGAILGSLGDAGFDAVVMPGVAGEPTPKTILDIHAAIGDDLVAAVVGIGGGSALDAAKLVAAAATNRLDLTRGLGPAEALEEGPLIAAMPTTAGTGAEATAVAMLWHDGQKRIFVNHRLVPRHATLDPLLMVGLPAHVLAASGLDAVSHAIESLLSLYRNAMTVSAAQSALGRLSAALLPAFAAPDDELRGEMLLGAHEAGLALNASVVGGHSMAYAVASRAGLSHGVTCAMALPYCLAYCRDAAEPVLAGMGRHLGQDERADAVFDWVVATTSASDMPQSLAAVGVEQGALAEMADEIVTRYPRPNSPAPLLAEPLRRLLEHFHAGDAQAAWDDVDARPRAHAA
jgi:alcohol dehydrogenase class IV